MLFNLLNTYEAQSFLEYATKLVKDAQGKTFFAVEVTRKRAARSGEQNRYLHLLLGYYASEFGYSLDEVKQDLYKRQLNPDIFVRKHINKRGDEVTYLRSSADLDTREMSLSIERFRNYSSAIAGLYLPSADEKNFLLYAEQQIQKYEEFL